MGSVANQVWNSGRRVESPAACVLSRRTGFVRANKIRPDAVAAFKVGYQLPLTVGSSALTGLPNDTIHCAKCVARTARVVART